MRSLWSLAIVLVLLVVFGSGDLKARQVTPEEVRQVLELLRTRSESPSLEDWLRIGPSANRILVDVANDGRLERVIRLRALASLAWFPSRRSEAVLVGRLHDRRYDSHEKAVAMLALARAFGARMTNEFRDFLGDSDDVARSGAIRALGLTGDRRALELLRSHLAREEVKRLRLETEAAIERLEGGQ